MQEIIVLLIVLACVNYAAIRIIFYFYKLKNGDNPCEKCSGCDLKQALDTKKEFCKAGNCEQ